jgi:putative protease
LLRELDGLANRGYTGGFYERHPDREYQSYLKSHSESDRSLYVGDVLVYDADGLAEIDVKNRFSVGDRIELIHPKGNLELTISSMQGKSSASVNVAPGSGHRVSIPLPAGYEGAFVARFVAEHDQAHT